MLVLCAFGQSGSGVQGLVLDAANGEPLANATVVVVGAALGVVTDLQGRFEIGSLLVGDYLLLARCLGHDPQQMTIHVVHDAPVECIFRLQPGILHLADVEIRADQWTGDRAGRTIHIGTRQIQESHARDVAELLQNLAGLEIREDGSVKTVSLEGGQANQVSILINGIRLSSPVTGQVDLTTLPLSALREVEIHYGAAGDGALTGAIDLRTGSGPVPGVTAKSYVQAFNGSGYNLSWSRRGGPFDLAINLDSQTLLSDYPYRYRSGEEWISDRRSNADSWQRQFFLTSEGRLAGGRWSAMAQSLATDRGLPGLVYTLTPWARSRLNRALHQVAYTFGTFDFKAGWQSERSQYRNTYGDVPLRYRSTPRYWTDSRFDGATLTAAWRRNTRLGQLDMGVEGHYTDYSDRDYFAAVAPVGRANNWVVSQFAQLHKFWPLRHRLLFNATGGWRYDYARLNHGEEVRPESAFTPFASLALRRQARIGWELTGSWSRGFRLPTFADLYYQQYRTRGNAALAPERSTCQRASGALFWPGGSLHLGTFRNRIEDLIIWRLGSFATYSPVNTDARLEGIETEIEWPLFRNWPATASYVYMHTVNLSDERTVRGKELPDRPIHSVKASVRGSVGHLVVEYAFRLIGQRFITEANTVAMPTYAVHDLTLSFSVRLAELLQTFKLSIYNFADRRFEIIENAPLPGREWRLTWQISQFLPQ